MVVLPCAHSSFLLPGTTCLQRITDPKLSLSQYQISASLITMTVAKRKTQKQYYHNIYEKCLNITTFRNPVRWTAFITVTSTFLQYKSHSDYMLMSWGRWHLGKTAAVNETEPVQNHFKWPTTDQQISSFQRIFDRRCREHVPAVFVVTEAGTLNNMCGRQNRVF